MNQKKAVKNSRELVLDMLLQTLEEGAFSHLVLQKTLKENALDPREKAFVLRLFHGVLEQEIFLTWIIQSYSKIKIKKMKPMIRILLLESLYQMLFMDSVPDRAAVSEAVKIAKKRGLSGLVPFLNGILRSFQREGIKDGMPEHVRHSAPLWLYERLSSELGKPAADAFFDAALTPGESVFARMNTTRTDADAILSMLEKDGCEAERVAGFEEALKLRRVNDLTALTAFREGLLFVQDLSSMQVGRKAAEYAEKETVKTILDVCAAPGGKSVHLAQLFPDAEVTARDIRPEKVERIRENVNRCGLTNVKPEVFDATKPDEAFAGKADLVLADLPCSGIGVIGRKADIKRRLAPEDIDALSALQKEILSVCASYVKDGGLLLYSTCTVSRAENQENTAWFLKTHPFRLRSEEAYLPPAWEGDGFYIAVFEKEEQKEA